VEWTGARQLTSSHNVSADASASPTATTQRPIRPANKAGLAACATPLELGLQQLDGRKCVVAVGDAGPQASRGWRASALQPTQLVQVLPPRSKNQLTTAVLLGVHLLGPSDPGSASLPRLSLAVVLLTGSPAAFLSLPRHSVPVASLQWHRLSSNRHPFVAIVAAAAIQHATLTAHPSNGTMPSSPADEDDGARIWLRGHPKYQQYDPQLQHQQQGQHKSYRGGASRPMPTVVSGHFASTSATSRHASIFRSGLLVAFFFHVLVKCKSLDCVKQAHP
jgi:hypothetical protein